MNLASELAGLVDQFEPIARPGGVGRVLMVMGGSRGAGASTVARELARLCAQRTARGVWLFDLDFTDTAQARATRVRGEAFDAGFGRRTPWQLGAGSRLVMRESAQRQLFVSEIQTAPETRLQARLSAMPEYWQALREAIDLAIIDAPGQSRAPLVLAPDVDGVILVADARQQDQTSLMARREAIEAAGGVVAGVIVNRAAEAGQAA